MKNNYNLKFSWTVSRGRDTYGYNICTLYVDGVKRGRCNGGGYDMQGTALAQFIESEFKEELVKTIKNEYYGLCFFDPNWKPSAECLEQEKKDELTKLTGLARYQDFYKQTSKIPTKKHILPTINGACGVNSVERILNALGYVFKCIDYKSGVYVVEKSNELKKAV